MGKSPAVLAISLAFAAPTPAFAAANAGVKPGSFFYFFDTASENISLFFTFNPEQKVKKALAYADERLAKIEAIAEEKNPNAVKTALANHESNVALAMEKSKEVKKISPHSVREYLFLFKTICQRVWKFPVRQDQKSENISRFGIAIKITASQQKHYRNCLRNIYRRISILKTSS